MRRAGLRHASCIPGRGIRRRRRRPTAAGAGCHEREAVREGEGLAGPVDLVDVGPHHHLGAVLRHRLLPHPPADLFGGLACDASASPAVVDGDGQEREHDSARSLEAPRRDAGQRRAVEAGQEIVRVGIGGGPHRGLDGALPRSGMRAGPTTGRPRWVIGAAEGLEQRAIGPRAETPGQERAHPGRRDTRVIFSWNATGSTFFSIAAMRST